MNPKRPPSISRPPVTTEWNPSDTQRWDRIDVAQEVEWRRDVKSKMEAMAEALGSTRDVSRTNESAIFFKASKEELASLAGEVKLLTERVATLKHVTWGVLVVFIVTVLLEKKGIL